MRCRGIRGATVAAANEACAIVVATRELLEQIVAVNGVAADDLAAVIFTTTPDLDAAYPARAARELGWLHTPLMCTQEMQVVGSLPRCIRVLMLWNTELSPEAIRHVYLSEARTLRPDLMKQTDCAHRSE